MDRNSWIVFEMKAAVNVPVILETFEKQEDAYLYFKLLKYEDIKNIRKVGYQTISWYYEQLGNFYDENE